jgi:hypothetical protein
MKKKSILKLKKLIKEEVKLLMETKFTPKQLTLIQRLFAYDKLNKTHGYLGEVGETEWDQVRFAISNAISQGKLSSYIESRMIPYNAGAKGFMSYTDIDFDPYKLDMVDIVALLDNEILYYKGNPYVDEDGDEMEGDYSLYVDMKKAGKTLKKHNMLGKK